MKMRLLSFFSLAAGYALVASLSGFMGGCGGGGGGTGTAGTGGGMTFPADQKISDFEDLAAAVVTMDGTPARNGYWYTYNDNNPPGTDANCMQMPRPKPVTDGLSLPQDTVVGTAPPMLAPGTTGSLALHVSWSGCEIWGAGVGADLFQPPQADGGTYTGPKIAYDVSQYTGVAFWAMAVQGTATKIRMKLPMRVETKVEDGGTCVEAPTNKCSDDFGQQFTLPNNGTWKQFFLKFSDTAAFKQEGWGAIFPWNPADVTSIQVQSVDFPEIYDIWLDDIYFTK